VSLTVGILSVSGPHNLNVNVIEPYTHGITVSEPHGGNSNVSLTPIV